MEFRSLGRTGVQVSVLALGTGSFGGMTSEETARQVMQAALDAANSGYYVYLVERSTSIGGVMSQLDKTFPTNDCAM